MGVCTKQIPVTLGVTAVCCMPVCRESITLQVPDNTIKLDVDYSMRHSLDWVGWRRAYVVVSGVGLNNEVNQRRLG